MCILHQSTQYSNGKSKFNGRIVYVIFSNHSSIYGKILPHIYPSVNVRYQLSYVPHINHPFKPLNHFIRIYYSTSTQSFSHFNPSFTYSTATGWPDNTG